ncbi:hypothetical protein GCM10022224_031050 [Nonomuraea antimicrobica]|uniref:Esterase n=1 Tax=Nonomuraea antimicrobica TaxID=561173 RepID=A0ABP7BM17_9ACTN
MDWTRREFGVGSRPELNVIGGASLGGLTALYTALGRPDVFPNVISLIGAVGLARYGERDWLLRQYAESPRLPLNIYQAAGLLDNDVFPGGIPPMLDANRRLQAVLREKGYPVTYHEFAGGHDWVWLADTFAQALVHLLAGPSGAHQRKPVHTEGNPCSTL